MQDYGIVPKHRLGTSKFNDVILKVILNPTQISALRDRLWLNIHERYSK